MPEGHMILKDERQNGYRREDMDRIMRDGDMDGIDAVVGWKPIGGIGYSGTGDPNAIATEARRAETSSASVHEGADPKGIAQ